VVAVCYKTGSLTRGSKYSEMTWKLDLLFWKTGRWGEMVAYKRFQIQWFETGRLGEVVAYEKVVANGGSTVVTIFEIQYQTFKMWRSCCVFLRSSDTEEQRAGYFWVRQKVSMHIALSTHEISQLHKTAKQLYYWNKIHWNK